MGTLRKNVSKKAQKLIESVKESLGIKKQYHGQKQKGKYLEGGFRSRNTQAIYYPPNRGKLKGYMR